MSDRTNPHSCRRVWLIAGLLATALFANAQGIVANVTAFAHIEGDSLSGKKATLPDDARGKITLVAIGFSRKSGDATRAWTDRFKKDFGSDPKFAIYLVAELEGAPHFVRGMILGAMRRNTPAAEQDHFITLFQGDTELKSFAKFSAPDDAYLFLLDAKGAIQWRSHGVFRGENYAPLREAASKLASP